MALYATTDMMTTVTGFVSAIRKALRSKCGISVAEYRLLAHLTDLGEPVRPSDAMQALAVSPAMVTLTAKSLVEKGLAKRVDAKSGAAFAATKRGTELSRIADSVLEDTHDSLLSLLDAEQKNTIVVGTQMTVMATMGSNRMKGDSFFGEYETLRAFLVIEKVMTESAKTSGLSMNGFRILFRLGESGRETTPGELADVLALAPPVITHALKGLERDGLVARSSKKLDKRSVCVHMTDRGAETLDKAVQHMDPLLISGIRAATASERRLIQEACEHIASAVRRQARQSI